jgi:phage/plasmid-associated DNA primase
VFYGGDYYTFGREGWQGRPADSMKSEMTAAIKNYFRRAAIHAYEQRVAQHGTDAKPVKLHKVTNTLLGNVDTALKSLTRLPDGTKVPVWVDSGTTDSGHHLVFPNGILNLNRYFNGDTKLMPPTPRFFSPYTLPYDFQHVTTDPQAFLAMLDDQMLADEIRLVQEFFGLCYIPELRYERGLTLYGPNRSGKGLCIKTLAKGIGEWNYVSKELYNFGNQFALDCVPGKLVIGFPDERKEQNRNTTGGVSRLLKLVSGDSMDVQRKYKDSETRQLVARAIIGTNYLPELRDESNGLRARLAIVKTRKSYEGQENRQLFFEITKDMAAFTCWCLRGLKRLQDRGDFVLPDNGVQREYSLVNAPISLFVTERCNLGGSVPKAQLYSEYVEFMAANGHEPIADSQFYRELWDNNPNLRNTRSRDGGNRVWYVQGLSLKG